MQANRPDNFDDMLHKASGRNEYKPTQKVWKGIAAHFDKVDRNRRIWQASIFAAFTLLCTFSALYYNSKSDTPIANNLSQLKGREIFENKISEKQTTTNIHNPFIVSYYTNNIIPKSLTPNPDIIDESNADNKVELLSSIKKYNIEQLNTTQNIKEPVAQYKPIRKPSKKSEHNRWQLGFNVGYSNCRPIGAASPDVNRVPLQSIQIGSSIGYNLAKKVSIISGINIYKIGVSYYFPGMNSSTFAEKKNIADIYTNSFWVAEVPLIFNYNGIIKNSFGFSIGAGIAAQFKLPSHSNDGGYHIMNYGRKINGVYLVNAKLTKETKNYKIAMGITPKVQMFNTNHNGNYMLLQTGVELSIGFKL